MVEGGLGVAVWRFIWGCSALEVVGLHLWPAQAMAGWSLGATPSRVELLG